MKKHDSKIKPVLKIADDFLLDLRQTAANPVIEQLEASMQQREMSLEQQLRKSKKLPDAKY
jgi:hypothetical protein